MIVSPVGRGLVPRWVVRYVHRRRRPFARVDG